MNNENIKKIGLWNIVGLGVGGAVGSGIFVTLGSAIERTGRSILPITIICVFYMLLAYWYNLGMSGIFVINGGCNRSMDFIHEIVRIIFCVKPHTT